jgi:hypothetical protein
MRGEIMARKKLSHAACQTFMDRYNDSNLTVAQFCRKVKVSPSTFYNRRNRALVSSAGNEQTHPLKFIPLAAPAVQGIPNPANQFSVSLTGGIVLNVPMQFDSESASALLRILREQGF